MSFLRIFTSVKPICRNLSNGRVLEYLNLGNGVTKSRILRDGQEVLTRTAKVNKETGERLISEISSIFENLKTTTTKYFNHTKINNVYDETGNLLKRNKLIETGVVNPSSKGGYCRTSDVSLISQKSNGYISEIKCTLPNFEYVKNLDTSPTIFN